VQPSYSKGFSDFNCRNFINYCHVFCKKAIAFTLAETLIVMGIIGVVAALTLPNLNSSTGEKEKVAKLKKIYSNLQDAYGRATAVYGPFDEWFQNDAAPKAAAEIIGERFTEFMKVSKNCGVETGKGCFADKFYFLDYDDGDPADSDDELVPLGYDLTGNLDKAYCAYSLDCTAWVIKNDNMDYLKADGSGKCNGVQLNWDTQTTCK